MKNFAKSAVLLLPAALVCSLLSPRPVHAQTKKEYLSDAEADKIRDAGLTGPRLVLYAIFAGDRIKKLQYEFAHLDPADEKRTDRINSLINGYTGCIDDAADLLDLGLEKQEDMRDGVKALQAQIKDSLPYLQDLAAKGPERDTYKDNLDDAIEATQDAAKELEKVSKEMAPVPVRRKPS
jgi:hypothetical protein